MRSFASDNNSGVHPLVMEALNRANRDHAIGYGDDPWTEEAVRKIREAFTPDCEPLFVFNGTGSNAVALQLCTRPYNSIICAETAHIYVDGPNPSKPATRPAYRQCPAPNIAKYRWLRAANDAVRRNGTNKDGLNRASACRQG